MRSASALVLRCARASSSLSSFSVERGLKGLPASFVQLRHHSQRGKDSSASNWGAGEPPIDEKQTQRGVPRSQFAGSVQEGLGTVEVGRQDEAPTSTSSLDSGASSSLPSPGPGECRKSRTGIDMSDDGQVHTPHLGKMRTTRDMIQSKGKETEDRLSGSKKT